MSLLQDFHLKNLRDEDSTALKHATNAWTACISRDFLPKWQSGEKLNINEVCMEERAQMDELQGAKYDDVKINQEYL